MLKAFYESVGDKPAAYARINLWQVADSLGFDRDKTLAVYDYLRAEGLLESRALGGWATITHWGIKEVEDVLKGRETEHFDQGVQFNINIIGQNSGNIAIGNENVQTQVATDPAMVAHALREALEQVQRPLPPEADALVALVEQSSDDRLGLAAAISVVAQKANSWKSALQDFALQAGAGVASSMVVDLIKVLIPR